MRTALLIILIVFGIGLSFHAVRYYKLRTLQKKRNNCDLTTEEGRAEAVNYNAKINQLMNFEPTRK